MSLPSQPPEPVQRQPWDQLPGEPALWYGRFCLYRDLGPSRSLIATTRVVCAAKHKHAWSPSQSWTRAANTWHWRERALAWDAHQREALTVCEYNIRLAARNRRIAITEENIDLAREGIGVADLPSMTQEEARAALPLLRRFLVDMLKAQRKEFEIPIDDGSHDRPITADDLRAAMRALQEQAQEAGEELLLGDRPRRAAALPGPGEFPIVRPPRDRRLRLFVCPALGSAGGPLDPEAMRALGLPVSHIYEADHSKFRKAFNRERNLRRPIELLHIDLRTDAESIEFANGPTRDGWRVRDSDNLRIVVLGRHAGPDPGPQFSPDRPAWCAAVPNLITLAADMPAGDARTFAEHFWAAVAEGQEAGAALQDALAAIPRTQHSCVTAQLAAEGEGVVDDRKALQGNPARDDVVDVAHNR